MKRILLPHVLMLILGSCAGANGVVPVIEAREVGAAPVLDGVLDDECWASLPAHTGFIDSDTRNPVSTQTVASICYDRENIYVAFHAATAGGERVKAEETRRNGGSFNVDDFVAISIDSRHTHRGASWFGVNAIGTQSEMLEQSSSTNIQYKGDWQAAARLTDNGYSAEMAIPFSLLVYGQGQDTFGICFHRNLGNDSISTEWPDLKGLDDKNYYAHWKGLKLPRFAQRLQILGFLLGTMGGDEGGRNYQGMDIKYLFAPNKVGIVSVNPDNSLVEQQVESVGFSYTERLLSDARPFFSEWQMATDPAVFYSRRIEDFDVGAKLVGNHGPHSFGAMGIRSLGQDNMVASYSCNIAERSEIRCGLADHSVVGVRNTVANFESKLGWANGQRNHNLMGGICGTRTSALPDGRMEWYMYSTEAGDGSIGGYVHHSRVGDTFNSMMGYVTNTGQQGTSMHLSRRKSYRGSSLQQLLTEFDVSDWDYLDGRNYESFWSVRTKLTYFGGRAVDVGFRKQIHEQFHEVLPYTKLYWNQHLMYRDGAFGVSWGNRAGGSYLLNWFEQRFRVGEKTALGLYWEYESITEPSPYAGTRSQAWLSFNHDLSSERSIGGRVVVCQGARNLFLMYRQQMRRGTDIYLVYGDPNAAATKGKVTLKLARVL